MAIIWILIGVAIFAGLIAIYFLVKCCRGRCGDSLPGSSAYGYLPDATARRRGQPVSETLDLHGCKAADVEQTVHDFLQRKLKENKRSKTSAPFVKIITGRGNHSPDRQPVVKPMVEKYLKERGYWYEWGDKGGSATVDVSSVKVDIIPVHRSGQ